jgi:hypothetical protein
MPVTHRIFCEDARTLARLRLVRRVHIPGLTLMRKQPMTA